jgi:ABC-type sugar transport system, periplasmic component
MRAKRILAVMLSLAMVIGIVACGTTGSSGSTNSQKSSKTITIWAWDDNFNVKAANLAKALYAKDHPDVTVNVVSMAQADIVQKLNTALSSGTYNGLPNIVLIEDYRIQNYLNAYPGELKDLSSIVKKDNFMNYKFGVMTEGNKIYGVPFDSGVAALFYRTDYIKEAGYTQADMQNLTWDKYIEIGKAVKAKTGKSMLTLDPSDLGQIRIMMQSAGSWYVKQDGKTVDIAGNTALKESILTYKKIVDSGIATQVSGWDAFVGAFQKGDVASVPTGCWIAPTIAGATDQSGKWAVTQIPRLGEDPQSINASNIGGASWYVLDKVGNSSLAADFLDKTFASNTGLMNTLAQEINLVSTLKAASTTENYQKGYAFFGGQKIFQDFSTWTNKIPPVNYGLYTYAIEDTMTQSVQSILQGANIDETLKNAQTQAEAAVVK